MKMRALRFWFLGLFLLGAPAIDSEAAGEPSLEIHEKNLGELQQKIERLKMSESTLKASEQDLSRELNTLEKKLKLSILKRNLYRQKVKKTKMEAESLKAEAKRVEGEIGEKEGEIFTSLKSYHKITVARRFNDNPAPQMILRNFIGRESGTLKGLLEKRTSTLAAAKKKSRSQKDFEKEQLAWKSKAEVASAEKKEKAMVFSQIQKKKKLTESELKELEEHKKALETLIASLRAKTLAPGELPIGKSYILAQKGSLPWPVKGEVVAKYGRQKHPTLNIVTINNGVRIKADHSVPVKAIEKGKVIFASEFKSYGLTVILDHGGDFYSIYGLLSELKVQKGIEVARGQSLGIINGSLEPQLYFELRNGGTPEDPLAWIK